MGEKKTFRRLLIGAASSGSGKTIITCALLRILERKGYLPAAYKCGPDYIDPMFHKSVLGIPSRNLDRFLAGEEGVMRSLSKGASGRNIGIIEGVMGFYDGMSAASIEGSAYNICRITDTPAILIINCRGMSNSVIAMAKGFCEYVDENRIKGIILNNISGMVAGDISRGIAEKTGIPVIATLPVMKDIGVTSRHLGLVMPGEIPELLSIIDKVADELEKSLDFDKLIEIADSAGGIPALDEFSGLCNGEGAFLNGAGAVNKAGTGKKIRIGIARDEAFCFYYDDNLELLCEMGAELVPFSPIRDLAIPDVSGVILGGGYPELYADKLSENESMKKSIREAAAKGMPILAECGGFLYLMEYLKDPDGTEYEMAGVFSGKSHMTEKLSHFGYVNVSAQKENDFLKDGEVIRAHEFHYYDTTDNGDICRLKKPRGKREWDGYRCKNRVFAGFAHLYYPSCREFIKRFLA